MIARNPLLRSMTTVFLFWYVGLALVAGFRGVPLYEIPRYLLGSTAVLVLGATIGLLLIIAFRTLFSQVTESVIREGGGYRDLRIALGQFPALPGVKRAPLPRAFLDTLPWWDTMREQFPAHAAAMKAVLEVMHTRPSLPASPVPGGHGGRTLIAHSLGVAGEMVSQAKTWQYEGQRDKRGRLRERLSGPPHRFEAKDAGLLVLAGLAHDIGKIVCFEDGGRDENGHPRVREVNGNHDHEGGRILRRLPEVMALPYADRAALLVAVGYYHHPFGMPRAGWLTDRMRSLTELLIKADIATGRKEGHVLAPTSDGWEEEDEVAPPPPVEQPIQDEDEAEEDVTAAAINSLSKRPGSTEVAPAAPRATQPHGGSGATRAQGGSASAQDEEQPYELGLFLRLMSRETSINGRDKNRRVAWKFGDRLYVMEAPFRREVQQFGKLPPGSFPDFQEENGNAAPFTRRLLEQLDRRGWLVRVFDGRTYPPSRAIFYAMNANPGEGRASPVPVFIVKTTAVPSSRSIPNANPMLVTRAMWDPLSTTNAKGMKEGGAPKESAPDHGATASMTDSTGSPDSGGAAVVERPTMVVDSVDHPFGPPSTSSAGVAAERERSPAGASQSVVDPGNTHGVDRPTATLDAVDYPFDTPSSTTVSVHEATVAAEAPERVSKALGDALLAIVKGPSWKWPTEIETRPDGIVRIDVNAEGESGKTIAAALSAYQACGISTAGVRKVRRRSDGASVYTWETSAQEDDQTRA